MKLGTANTFLRQPFSATHIHSSIKWLAGIAVMGSLIGCGDKTSQTSSQEQQTPSAVVAEQRYLIGAYTDGAGQGVYGISLNNTTGQLTDLGLMAETTNPSYVAVSEDASTLYTVNETENGGVSAFVWDETQQSFSLQAATQGVGFAPCHITLGPDGKLLAVANYMSSDVQLFSREQGDNLALVSTKTHTGKGPHSRQEAPHPHWINWSPDGKYVYSVDLGLDQVIKYTVSGTDLSDGEPALTLKGGDGPRHMAFHAEQNVAYLLNELSNTVAVLSYHPETGRLTETQRVSTLAPSFKDHSQAAAIKISPDQRFVYASNRGAHTIAVFAIADDGSLSYVHEQSVEGEWPRDFSITEDGKYVIVANEHSSNIVLLARDSSTGKLSSTGTSIAMHRPTAVVKF